ncbi:MAG: glycosyltransferase family 4 protein [Thermoleophilales bacterium]|nr:glycosyltransferase family 4 protein [Thermoleophilales bacterium]
MLIAHAFTPEGNRNQLHELGRQVELKVLAPRSFLEQWGSKPPPAPDGFIWVEFPILHVRSHQFLALSPDLGIRTFDPEVIHVDYPPWSLIFWQVLVLRMLFAPKARLIAGAKKNTFRTRPGVLGRFKSWLARAGLVRIDQVEAASRLSQQMLERQLNVTPDKISVIPHMGVDTKLFKQRSRPAPDSPVVVGYCGKYSEHKGVLVLLEAVEHLRSKGLDIHLHTIGQGPLEVHLKEIESRSPWLQVFPASPSLEVASFMGALDVYVLPALICPDHQEHDGHALLQAMATGVPSIGTDSGVIPDILGNGSGLLVPPNDSMAIAEAIETLTSDESIRRACIEASADLIKDTYTLEAVANARLQMYSL